MWTFKIRQGVKFHNGASLTADDVVYTYKLHSRHQERVERAVLLRRGARADRRGQGRRLHGEFQLEAPNGNFPYLTSSENYNMIIIPNNYDPAKWQSTFVGTGPFKLGSYTPKVGASFTRNESYWGTKALPSATQFTFYDTRPRRSWR